ncbi:MAG: MATE family efflux transporter [Bacilli bacterium]|nr:MATE family efflux transporter [Bacilli bacterium]
MFKCFTDKEFITRFLKISLPVMLAAFITFLVTFIDNIMVGSVSNEAVSGVYAANEVTFVFEISGFGIIEGAGIFLQQFNGTNDKEHMKQCFRYKLIAGIGYLLVAIPLVFFFGKYLVNLYCQSDSNFEQISKEANDYLNLILISYIPFIIGTLYSYSLREIGKTKYAMYSSFIAVVANIIFNYIFIIVLQKGVKGAAIATIISRILEMSFLITISHIKKMPFCHRAYFNFHIEKELFINISKKTAILFINEVGWSLGMILQSMAYSQRDSVLSAISVVSTVNNVIQILINSLSIGIGVMIGSSLGQEKYEKAKYEAKNLNLLGLYSALVVGLIFVGLSPFIPQLFNKVDPAQKELATLLIIILGSLLFGRTLCASIYFILKAGGNAVLTFFYDTGLMILVYLPVAWGLAVFTSLDMVYIYLIVTSIDVVKALLGLLIMKKTNWANNLTHLEKVN